MHDSSFRFQINRFALSRISILNEEFLAQHSRHREQAAVEHCASPFYAKSSIASLFLSKHVNVETTALEKSATC